MDKKGKSGGDFGLYTHYKDGSITNNEYRTSMERSVDKNGSIIKNGYRTVLRFHRPEGKKTRDCLLYTSPSPRDLQGSRMPSSA